MKEMKTLLLILFIFSFSMAKAQKVDSMFVNLYTDSLKKGTYNYINVDGLLSNGRYLPLDSTHLVFWASAGKFFGNSLWIDRDFKEEKVSIKVMMKNDRSVNHEFVMYVKKKEDDEQLKTEAQLLEEMKSKSKKKTKN